MSFCKEYIIPKPFDHRALTWIAPAVAKAAMDTGVARKPIEDFEEYKMQLNIRMGRTEKIMARMYQKARINPKRIVFPEGEQPTMIKAAQMSVDAGIAHPILIGSRTVIRQLAEEYGYDLEGIEIINPLKCEKIDEYTQEYFNLRQRHGIIRTEARKRMRTRPNYFGAMMVHMGDADAMISGFAATYPDTIKPALEIIVTGIGTSLTHSVDVVIIPLCLFDL